MKGITNFDSSYPRKTITKYEIKSSRKFEVRYLKSLYKSGYRIIDPIEILVENPKTKEDEYIVEVEAEGENVQLIYSYGKTLQKAIKSLRWQLVELYEMLEKEDINNTMPICMATKKFLEKHIERKKLIKKEGIMDRKCSICGKELTNKQWRFTDENYIGDLCGDCWSDCWERVKKNNSKEVKNKWKYQ